MLSLVSYDSSGDSEDDDNSSDNGSSDHVKTCAAQTMKLNESTQDEEQKFNNDRLNVDASKSTSHLPNTTTDSASIIQSVDSKTTKTEELSNEDNILSKLPPPVTDLRSIPWDQLSKLTYKSRAIRILAPAIPEDVEEKKEKKIPSKAGSGLLSMLPKPRNEFLATPTVLKSASTKKLIPPSIKSKPTPKPKAKSAVKPDSDSDGETAENVDFFSLSSEPEPHQKGLDNATVKDSTVDIPLPPPSSSSPADIPMPTQQSATRQSSSSFYVDTNNESVPEANSSSYDYVQFQSGNDELQLDSEALAALCGSRGLKRRAGKDEAFKIIDIDGSQLTPDAQEVLTKNLTVDQPRPKRHNKDGPTSQQKRKHQIIYLAHQAKEQELELQNTWSNNRMTKKQTQAKYGF